MDFPNEKPIIIDNQQLQTGDAVLVQRDSGVFEAYIAGDSEIENGGVPIKYRADSVPPGLQAERLYNANPTRVQPVREEPALEVAEIVVAEPTETIEVAEVESFEPAPAM